MSLRATLYEYYRQSGILPPIWWRLKKSYRGVLAEIASRAFDRRYGIETAAALGKYNLGFSPEATPHASSYNAIDVGQFKRMLAKSQLDPGESCFIDVGSGKGRALFMAAEMGF